MIQFIDEMPQNITAIKISGKLTESDLDSLLYDLGHSSHIQENLQLLILFEDFEGWPDGSLIKITRFLISNRGSLAQIALVGGGGETLLERMPSFLPGLEIERFETEADARAWLVDDDDHWTVNPTRFDGKIRAPKDMRILIVGAGVAGLTLASMLQQRDMQPVVVEDAEEFGKIGYVIILLSAGGRILKGLGAHDELHKHGIYVQNYDIANSQGETLREHNVDQTYAPLFGYSYSIYRPALVDVIKQSMQDQSVIRMGTTVDAIKQTNDEVHVTFSDGSEGTFDLVVGADGLHSRVRNLVFGEVDMIYSGLHGWAWWGEKNAEFDHRAVEHWGTGGAFGLYPTEDRLCIVGVVNQEPGLEDDPATRKQRIREHFSDWGGWVPYGLDQLDGMDDDEIFHDDFYYGNQRHWYRGRVVLAGDSVHAFSPISGMGASMAMESAAVLAEELCYVDSRYIDQALRKYQDRRQDRVFGLQKQAQAFGNVVTSGNPMVTSLRNLSVRHIDDGPVHHFLARIPYEPV
jgi:2-polyprenyl-6-methoxyphenol hydroxylase-like FAD-dependent oxidoreductase